MLVSRACQATGFPIGSIVLAPYSSCERFSDKRIYAFRSRKSKPEEEMLALTTAALVDEVEERPAPMAATQIVRPHKG